MLTRYSSLTAVLLIVGLALVFMGPERNALPNREDHAFKVDVLPDHPRFKAEMAKRVKVREALEAEMRRLRLEGFQAARGTAPRPNRATSGAALVDEMEICGWFASKNPSPQERVKLFAGLAQSHECVIAGWFGAVQSVQAVQGGKRIQVSLSPHLVSIHGGVPFTSMNCIEEWLATADGEMQFIKVNLGDRPGIFMTD